MTKKDKKLLASCYTSCLKKADAYHLKSIAFCCISTGVFMFSQDKAAEIAVRTEDTDYEIYDSILNHKIRIHNPVL